MCPRTHDQANASPQELKAFTAPFQQKITLKKIANSASATAKKVANAFKQVDQYIQAAK